MSSSLTERRRSQRDSRPSADLTSNYSLLAVPIMDGLTALREIRSMEARGDLPGHQGSFPPPSFSLPVRGAADLFSRSVCLSVTGNARKGQIEAVKEAGGEQSQSHAFPSTRPLSDDLFLPFLSRRLRHQTLRFRFVKHISISLSPSQNLYSSLPFTSHSRSLREDPRTGLVST